ncbi:MAG: bifunctional 3,4-dihydroxy-2-butanone 4-phosphate synthase/GTP cyclohydrolase [Solirubrobacterales bacterium]|nr:bifunctional 3,4-dihydroxy-2-butanone 4-phosphate synthase/GTP cyclohydrolase [Solirubrobacterales bacterium]
MNQKATERDSAGRAPCWASVDEAIAAVARGEFVVVADGEERENEGDLIMAAACVTPEAMAFLVRHTSGLACVGMSADRCEELQLPLMVPDSRDNRDALGTAFTVSVDLADGMTTGISAAERAATVRALADPTAQPGDFVRPGHVFPLKARPGGVLKRAGHTEAAADLASLAGMAPAGVLCEIVNDDGTMARRPQLAAFAQEHGLAMITIAQLVAHRRRHERLVEPLSSAPLETAHGPMVVHAYRSLIDHVEHLALVAGDVSGPEPVLVRVHSECLTGDVFGSARCDCGTQLELAQELIAAEGRGIVVYLRGQEGRGIGLGHKLRAYNLQDRGFDTVDANLELNLPVDSREYGIGAQILADLGVASLRLITNNPAKYEGLAGYGLQITERIPLIVKATPQNARYLDTKRRRMGHLLPIADAAG